MIFWQIEALLEKYDCSLSTPIGEIPDEAMNEVLYGALENVKIKKELVHTSSDYFMSFDGVVKYLQNIIEGDDSVHGQKWADQFLAITACPACNGARLKPESLAFRIGDKNIADVSSLDIIQARLVRPYCRCSRRDTAEYCARDYQRNFRACRFPPAGRT